MAPDHLRFDFSHGASVKDGEIESVESLVNEQVQANVVVSPAEMDLQEALAHRARWRSSARSTATGCA